MPQKFSKKMSESKTKSESISDRASTIGDDAKSHTTTDTVAKMKAAVVRKKGRGFDSEIDHTEYSEYDRLEDPDDFDEIGLDHDKSSGPGPQRSVEGWILFIRGLHEETTEDDKLTQASVHIISQTETTTVPETTAIFSRVDEDSSQTSDVGEAVNHSAPESSTFHVISQEAAGLDPNSQYVDLSIKEGEHVRLKVPLDADPMVYAKEYLQSLSIGLDESQSS